MKTLITLIGALVVGVALSAQGTLGLADLLQPLGR